ncbi:MAG: hypothetical protein COB67_02430 [SAR324 cluster bacterium]|uniref:Uncharacterized protein n=1 Tax=SAR324 cluster bacterium TaxID=2024889 RepID=A0A2A4T9Y4_9DELT|nr:MAG: hypothetical protein COB67_02430 [SAR324 cluster bacterium]
MMPKNELVLNCERNSIDILQVITFSTNQGGVITLQVNDGIDFLFDNDYVKELSFLATILKNKEFLEESTLSTFFKALFFEHKEASNFVSWQRNKRAA